MTTNVVSIRESYEEDIARLAPGYEKEEGYIYFVIERFTRKGHIERLARMKGDKKHEFYPTKRSVWQKICVSDYCWCLTGGSKRCKGCHGYLVCSVEGCRERGKGGYGGKCTAHGGGKTCKIYACGHCRIENSIYCGYHSSSAKCKVVNCGLPTTWHEYCSIHGGQKLPWKNWETRIPSRRG